MLTKTAPSCLVRAGYLKNHGEQHTEYIPDFDRFIREKKRLCCLKRQLLLDLRFSFLYPFFRIFLMYIQIPSKKRPDQTTFVLTNLVFFPLGLEVSDQKKQPDAPSKADSQVPLPRPAPVDVEGSDLDGIFVSKM